MLYLYTHVQFKCDVCDQTSSIVPGFNYETLECPVCKERKEKEKLNAKPKRKRSTKNIKEV